MLAQLPCAAVGERPHIGFRAELQTARRARLDARGLETLAHAIRAERALEHLFRCGVELRDIERATRDAVLTPDAVLLLKIDDAVRVLHDSPVGRTGAQASGI